LEFDIKVYYPYIDNNSASQDASQNFVSASSTITEWKESLVKAGKKWCLPIEIVGRNQANFIKILPVDK
jgi:hypothetical protein